MYRVASILACLGSFIAAGALHFNIQSLSNSKNPALPQYIYKDIDESIAELETLRLIAFSVATFLLFFTVLLFNTRKKDDPEILDE